MTDMRDPKMLGEVIPVLAVSPQRPKGQPLSEWIARFNWSDVPDHDSNPSCIDKYGYAQGVKPE